MKWSGKGGLLFGLVRHIHLSCLTNETNKRVKQNQRRGNKNRLTTTRGGGGREEREGSSSGTCMKDPWTRTTGWGLTVGAGDWQVEENNQGKLQQLWPSYNEKIILSEWIKKQLHVCIIQPLKKEGHSVICDSTDGLRQHYAKWTEPDKERQILACEI